MEEQPLPPGRCVAFLRAINVGGRTVKMDRLRALFAALDLGNAATFIASGNVIFDSPGGPAGALERRIEAHLREALGFEVTTFVRSAADVAAVARYDPFPGSGDGAALMISFLAEVPPPGAAEALAAFRTDTDDFHVHGREVYWLRRGRTSDSAFSGAVLEKTLRMPATMRNATTVRKIAEKYPPLP